METLVYILAWVLGLWGAWKVIDYVLYVHWLEKLLNVEPDLNVQEISKIGSRVVRYTNHCIDITVERRMGDKSIKTHTSIKP